MKSKISVNELLVCDLIRAQFPQWSHLAVRPVARGGWNNHSFRLGEELLVRMPRESAYEAAVEKEQRWLPFLAPSLPIAIPKPRALGQPTAQYPMKWSIYTWLPGSTISPARIASHQQCAIQLAQFLVALRSADTTGGPLAGAHSFSRGGALGTYDEEARRAIALLAEKIDAAAAIRCWERACATQWPNAPVWVHGDISPGNLLFQNDALNAVIDFGQLAVGDPACDLVIAWTTFDHATRTHFRYALELDESTWARARGWALWKALIVAAELTQTNAMEWADPWRVIEVVLAEDRDR